MKVLRRAVKKVMTTHCENCDSRLQVEDSDVTVWFVENVYGHATCPVCRCKHVPVFATRKYAAYEGESEQF